CIDGPRGSALLSWSDGGLPFTQLRAANCEVAGRDRRDFLRAEGSDYRNDFLFPAGPTDFSLDSERRTCPHTISSNDIEGFRTTLEAVIASGKLTPTATEAIAGLMERLIAISPERLLLSGGEGNSDFWSVRC